MRFMNGDIVRLKNGEAPIIIIDHPYGKDYIEYRYVSDTSEITKKRAVEDFVLIYRKGQESTVKKVYCKGQELNNILAENDEYFFVGKKNSDIAYTIPKIECEIHDLINDYDAIEFNNEGFKHIVKKGTLHLNDLVDWNEHSPRLLRVTNMRDAAQHMRDWPEVGGHKLVRQKIKS